MREFEKYEKEEAWNMGCESRPERRATATLEFN